MAGKTEKQPQPSEANCTRCGMLCDHTNFRHEAKLLYENFFCYDCKKPFSILVSGKTFDQVINQSNP